MLRELEKRFVNNNVLLKNTSIWKGKKITKARLSVCSKKLIFSYGNLDWAARQPDVTQKISRKFFIYS